MKKLISLFIFINLFLIGFAQSPRTISYQAILRDNLGVLIQNAPNVAIRVSILQGNILDNNVVYQENHSTATNANGLFTIEVGGGTVVLGNYPTIQWGNGPYFLKTEIDPTGFTNYLIVATTELLSVPIANYAFEAGVAETANSLPGEAGKLVGYWYTANPFDQDFQEIIIEYVSTNFFWFSIKDIIQDDQGNIIGWEWTRLWFFKIQDGLLTCYNEDLSGTETSMSINNGVLSWTITDLTTGDTWTTDYQLIP